MLKPVFPSWKQHRFPVLMVFASLLFYISFGYDLARTDFFKLATLYTALFWLYVKLVQFRSGSFQLLVAAGILFRLALLWAEPNLSQDYYRFVWDGQLLREGINPYLHLPKDLIHDLQDLLPNARELYNGMGTLSASNYSNYPPLKQALFALSTFLGGNSAFGSAMAMRILLILADLGILWVGRSLLIQLKQDPHLIFWYFLNPLVILELTGNLHHEGVMLFFFLGSLSLLLRKKLAWAGLIYAFAISIKLIPLMFLPLIPKYLGLKKSLYFLGIIGGTCLLMALPFQAPGLIENYTQSVGLWFSNFEFNASFYNIVKYLGIQWNAKPWILIKEYGKITPWIIIALAALLGLLQKKGDTRRFMTYILIILSLYYFLSAVVHPWYIVFLLLISLFTPFRYPLVWSFTIILSYWAYSNPEFEENYLLLGIEYIGVYGFLIYEIVKFRKKKVGIP